MSSTSTPSVARDRAAIHEPRHAGERIADSVTGGMGSWRFIIIQTALVVVWMVANAWLLSRPFDPYPFILLNLAFSTQAAYASPLILMSQNRAAARDRARDDLEAREVHLMTRQLGLLERINRQQTALLIVLLALPIAAGVGAFLWRRSRRHATRVSSR